MSFQNRMEWEERCDRRLAVIMATEREISIQRVSKTRFGRVYTRLLYQCADPTVHISPKSRKAVAEVFA